MMAFFDSYNGIPRIRFRFNNGLVLSLVQLFPGEDLPYEALVVDGPDKVLDQLEDDFPYSFPISDVIRYDPRGTADLISRCMVQCGGLEQVYFYPEEQTKNAVDGGQ